MTIINSDLLTRYNDLMHAFTTRLNGHSMYGNNLAYHVGDKAEDVDKNHQTLARYLNYPLEKLVHMNQVHGNKIIVIEKEHDFKTTPSCDAIITQEKSIPLMVMIADCIPVLIYDPSKRAIGAVHAGRAGIFSEILPKTIQKMQDKYSCKAENILISIGPSIHQCCYEVGDEIKDEAERKGLAYAIKTTNSQHHLDLLTIAHKQLEKIGINKENIETSHYCTSCSKEKFYSYRAENNKCGRFSGIIMLK